ncbi:MAG: four helix bundle protein [Planctomycetes bacterium]|nr:four helix bundle protein [Planctomycetota bacterium]
MAESNAIESFRDLVAWQVAMDAVDSILELVAREPLSKKYWLCDQIARSSTSIAANIAEGHGSGSRRMYVKHLYIARGSLNETLTFMEINRRQKYATAEDLRTIRDLLHRTHKLLNGLIKSLQRKDIP